VGPALAAQQAAAKVFGADRTYFVLNGTSTSNKVVTAALLKRGDLVLFDRNNHKSNHQGALQLAGAIPIYLETDRNPQGLIGPIDFDALDEKKLREQIRTHPLVTDKDAWQRERPFRLAIVEQCSYDGTIYNADRLIGRIGHLCDYVHFDEAWAGFMKFHPLFAGHFAMGLAHLDASSPGIIATQSTHKQLAGFSQASQIHVRDEHIKGQSRRTEHRRFNEMYMLHCSTSPFYPLFASLDVDAQMHKGRNGLVLWDDAIRVGIEVRKKLRTLRKQFIAEAKGTRSAWFFDPFVPDVVTIDDSAFSPPLAGRRSLGGHSHRCVGPRERLLGADSRSSLARLSPCRTRLGHDRPEQADPAHTRLRPRDRCLQRERHPGHAAGGLSARTQHRPREVRSQQHSVPADTGG